ncbi:Predicted dienelactone hydrolase [Dyella sp. OK004]|uniref:alpha/beta hydrolase family protein n=1 Tax=Dyella sp. OK004 TaxID=1855292 RepID=UPI0008E5B16D|nr:hypothetical protein [Dyella sp. OK004]SFS07066.1 Predicted dienelactone hydrolase [Dyella sp. OK004]
MGIRFPRAEKRLAAHSRWLAALLWLLPLALSAQSATGVGMVSIRIPDPVSGGQTDGYVFYPSSQPVHGATAIGPYEVAAVPDAPALPGTRPLVVISHGNGGSRLGHHDLATYLASHGFIVATLNHPKDDFQDTSGVGHAEVLAGRPLQVKSTITTLLADPHWKNLIDPERIGVAGFSAGGYTSLMLLGARPKFERFIDFCDQHPEVKDVCGTRAKLEAEMAKQGRTIRDYLADVQNDMGHWGDTADPRVKAAFVMAPLSLVFDEAGLAPIHAPMFLYYGQNDHVLPPADNAKHIRPLLKNLMAVKEVPKADHWVFIAPCSTALAKEAPTICTDPAGVDRAKVHAQINADALAFFRKTLKLPGH